MKGDERSKTVGKTMLGRNNLRTVIEQFVHY